MKMRAAALLAIISVAAFLAFSIALDAKAQAPDTEAATLSVNAIKTLDLPFKIETFRLSSEEFVTVEKLSDMQLRLIGKAAGQCELQASGTGILSKNYRITVFGSIKESFSAIKKDLDALPELDITLNDNRIVLKGEVSSIANWELLLKVLPHYEGKVMNLAKFRPAPEVMLNLKKAFEKASYKVVPASADRKPGELSLELTGDTLLVSGSVYTQGDAALITQILSMQSWLDIGGKDKSPAKVNAIVNVSVVPTMLDVGIVYVGITSKESLLVKNNLASALRISNGINYDFGGLLGNGSSTSSGGGSYNLGIGINNVMQIMADSGVGRFRSAGHISFMSNEGSDFKTFHNGGTLKLRIYGGVGGTGALADVPYGTFLRVKGGLTGANTVRLDLDLEFSTPIPITGTGDYDLKQNNIKTSIICKLGETVALGGMRDLVQSTTPPSGVPVLRSVPVVKWFCSESGDTLTDLQVLVLIYPQVAGPAAQLKMPPSAETADTESEAQKSNQRRKEESDSKKSFWDRIF